MDKILAALKQLDPNNTNHWTQDGFPRVEAVRFLGGDQSLTKEQISAALPGFTREQALVAKAAEPAKDVAIVPPVTGVENAKADESISSDLDALHEEESEDEKTGLDSQLASAKRELEKLVAHKAEVDKAHKEQEAKVNDLLTQVDQAGMKPTLHTHLSGYFEQQQAIREEKIQRMKVIRESGIDFSALLDFKSPIDNSMSRRKKRGTSRPMIPLKG